MPSEAEYRTQARFDAQARQRDAMRSLVKTWQERAEWDLSSSHTAALGDRLKLLGRAEAYRIAAEELSNWVAAR